VPHEQIEKESRNKLLSTRRRTTFSQTEPIRIKITVFSDIF